MLEICLSDNVHMPFDFWSIVQSVFMVFPLDQLLIRGLIEFLASRPSLLKLTGEERPAEGDRRKKTNDEFERRDGS